MAIVLAFQDQLSSVQIWRPQLEGLVSEFFQTGQFMESGVIALEISFDLRRLMLIHLQESNTDIG